MRNSTASTLRTRIESVDVVRGLVMVIMALDHVRDYFSIARFNPTDLTQTTTGYFFTRWITHFCAPVFVFLAGTGAFFYGQRQPTIGKLSRFLLTRGLVLVLFEFTLVRWSLFFNFSYNFLLFLVIWAIGVSMIVLAALVYLPRNVIALIGIVMIVGHNAFDGIKPEAFGSLSWLWMLLHVQSFIPVSEKLQIVIGYPLIPWIGVMAAGYAFGGIYQVEPERRKKLLIRIGVGCILAFMLVRGINVYGDLSPWSTQQTPFYTFLSFLNTTKYPPSLSFLLLTLGPAILLLGLLEKGIGKWGRICIVYGKVPMFYFLLHFYLLHALAVVAGVLQGYEASIFFQLNSSFPPDYGYPLWGVYIVWAIVVVCLYPLCKWYGALKSRSTNPLLSYI